MHASNCCKTQKMCEKPVDTYTFTLECFPNCYNTQEICEKTVSKEPFILKYLAQYMQCVK